MSTFEIDSNAFVKEAWISMLAGVQVAQDFIIAYTPRDWDRPPQNIDRKDGKTPIRNTWRRPVFKDWHWYQWVTGNLKRSIWYEQKWPLEFIIGVIRWPTEEYADDLEFWTYKMSARSFLRRGIIEKNPEIISVIERTFQQLTQ
jgi:hypothetical protein